MLLLFGCSTLPIDDPDAAQLSDVASTAVGVSNGLIEANPVAAPMVNAGPPGWLAFAGVKLGLNRLAERQQPPACRRLLALNSALGWGATVNNVALLASPPLAIFAVPVAFIAYSETDKGGALYTCYEDRLLDVIVAAPQHVAGETLPAGLDDAIAEWRSFRPLAGTMTTKGKTLLHGLVLGDLQSFEHDLRHAGLDWEVLGAWDRHGEVAPVAVPALLERLDTPAVASDRKAAVLMHDSRSGVLTLHTGHRDPRAIAVVPAHLAAGALPID